MAYLTGRAQAELKRGERRASLGLSDAASGGGTPSPGKRGSPGPSGSPAQPPEPEPAQETADGTSATGAAGKENGEENGEGAEGGESPTEVTEIKESSGMLQVSDIPPFAVRYAQGAVSIDPHFSL